MNSLLTFERIRQISGGVWIAPPKNPSRTLIGGAFDTRSLGDARIFFAWKGENSDGHRYLNQLPGTSVELAVVEREVSAIGDLAILQVPDSLKTLQKMAGRLAAEFKGKIVSITGSCGKTTAKGWLQHLLSGHLKVLCSAKSFNNRIGCPITVLNLDSEHEAIVLEMGTSGRGELELLSSLFPADVSVLLNVGHAHLGKFGSRNEIYRAKTEIFKHSRQGAKFLIPFRDKKIEKFMPSVPYRYFGKGAPEFSWESNEIDSKQLRQLLTFRTPEGPRTVWVDQLGEHVGEILSALIAVCYFLGIPWDQFSHRLERLPQEKGRSVVIEGLNLVRILNDVYNANPESVVNMLKTLCLLDADRYVGVVGNLAEMDADLAVSADVIVEQIPPKLTHLILTGETGKILHRLIEKRYPKLSSVYASSPEETIDRAKRFCDRKTAIGVKGSRSAHMERVVRTLCGEKVSCGLAECGLLTNCSDCEKM